MPTVILSWVFTTLASHSGITSLLASRCSLQKDARVFAFTVWVIRSPYPWSISAANIASFISALGEAYLHFYEDAAGAAGVSPAHQMAITMIRDVLKETGITATVGIGTNLYLAKVGMDIVAKKAPPDKDGVRIADLDEDKYKLLLWDHRPLTDFWMIGPGTARKLEKHAMFILGDVATAALYDEGQFYKMFGIDAEILLDHVRASSPAS